MAQIINVQWVENGTIKYQNFLSDLLVDEFIEELKTRKCEDIKVELINAK